MNSKSMPNRKEILDRATSPEDKKLIARVLDRVDLVIKTHDITVTAFCDPYQQNLISPVLSKVPGISFLWAGGYDKAERKRLVACPDYMEARTQDAGLRALLVTGNLRFQDLSHRDYLGSLLGLGIKREKIGDLIITDGGCQVIVDEDIADYIMTNLTKVHRVGVKVQEITISDLRVPEEKTREIFATVPSLRLDAVAAAGFGVSRTKMAAEIAAERVKVNWTVVSDCSHSICAGDIISVRGKGRAEIEKVRGETKKGRLALIIKRYQ